jgi:hypothetical protein
LLIQANQLETGLLIASIDGGASLANIVKYRITLLLGVRKLLLAVLQGFAEVVDTASRNVSGSNKRHLIFSINSLPTSRFVG